MSDASAIYAEIDNANNGINQCKNKIVQYKSKKERLKKARGIIKDNKSEISDEKRNARNRLTKFDNWKGSNYKNHEIIVESDLIEGYNVYSNNLSEIIGEISEAIDRLNRKIDDQNEAIDRLRDLINTLYAELASLAEEEEED
jgi:chromosome segregation ATPase